MSKAQLIISIVIVLISDMVMVIWAFGGVVIILCIFLLFCSVPFGVVPLPMKIF